MSILLLTIAVPRLSFDRDRRLAFSNIAMSVARSTAGRPFSPIGNHDLPRPLQSPRHRCGHIGHEPYNIPGQRQLQIELAACRERDVQFVLISWADVPLKKKKKT